MGITYRSTRGTAPHLDLAQATLAGLASDGGLYVPSFYPSFTSAEIASLKGLPYIEVAARIFKPFMAPEFAPETITELLTKAYAPFGSKEVTPLVQLDDRRWILELFHGPTLAFKDIALQLLGHIFEYLLKSRQNRMTVIGATSGDTGSAAMAALANRKNIDLFVFYPTKGPSEIQRKQMTCIEAPNVHAIAIDGSFDDCQNLVKTLFADPHFREKHNLGAVNSINWLRILAQMVYYFVAAAYAGGPRPVSFAVPTGNFGNIFAAYASRQSGLEVSKLAVASNQNDILTRFFTSGRMKAEDVQATLSPSMDIQISSNFERLLFDLCRSDGTQVDLLMSQLRARGEFQVSPLQLASARQLFTASRVDDALTLETIADVYKETGYLLDPHSAVGVAAARQLNHELPDPVICLGCAHPAKFPETIRRATGITPELPQAVASLLQRPERSATLAPDIEKIVTFIEERTLS